MLLPGAHENGKRLIDALQVKQGDGAIVARRRLLHAIQPAQCAMQVLAGQMQLTDVESLQVFDSGASVQRVVTELLQIRRIGHSARSVTAQLPDPAGGAAGKGGEIKLRRKVQQGLLRRQIVAPLFRPVERGKARCTRSFRSLQRLHQRPTQSSVIRESLHQRLDSTNCRLVVLLLEQAFDGLELRQLRLDLGRRFFPEGFSCHRS